MKNVNRCSRRSSINVFLLGSGRSFESSYQSFGVPPVRVANLASLSENCSEEKGEKKG